MLYLQHFRVVHEVGEIRRRHVVTVGSHLLACIDHGRLHDGSYNWSDNYWGKEITRTLSIAIILFVAPQAAYIV